MALSASTLLTGGLATRRPADLLLAWMDAADDAHKAYAAWCTPERSERATAFVVYCAALDREEAAASALDCETRRP
jgi:hypothetical protein